MAFAASSSMGAAYAEGNFPSMATIRSKGPASELIRHSFGFRGASEIVGPDMVQESSDERASTVRDTPSGTSVNSSGATNGSIGDARRNITG